jgi:hypothetical protein
VVVREHPGAAVADRSAVTSRAGTTRVLVPAGRGLGPAWDRAVRGPGAGGVHR